jgi:altronate dehydratase large subunit
MGVGSIPHVGAVIVVSLGCETVDAERVAREIAAHGKPAHLIRIQEHGGTRKAAAAGTELARRLCSELARMERFETPIDQLVVGVECGGSDGYSGLSANPAVGVASDLLVAAGATVVFSETTECLGAEHLLARQAATPEIATQIVDLVRRVEKELELGAGSNLNDITPGNLAGGLTTIEEKSLGCIRKAGTTPIQEVIGYGERPSRRGLIMMDTPGQDLESVTALVAGGAQIIVFTTGRGTPTGSVAVPVLKVCSNTPAFEAMREDLDLDTGTVLTGSEALHAAGSRIFDEIAAVSSGKLVAAELGGHREFAVRRGGTACVVY